jgi:hypothetical protein
MRYVQFYFYIVIGSNSEGFGLAALIDNAIFLVQCGDCGVPVKQFPLRGNEKIEIKKRRVGLFCGKRR